jgi:DNA mismatch repair protein MSH3
MSKKRNREGPTYEEAVKAVCMRELRAEELTDSETLSLTPLDEQIYHLRCALPHDVLLLVTCGYKVKVLGRDSRVVSRRTGIMSIRCKPYESSSFPVQRLPHYVGRLVDMGYQVAFADQVETAAVRATSKGSSGSTAQKKVFERRVTAVYCRGTTSAASLASLSAAPQSGDSSAAAGMGDEDEEEPLQPEATEEPMGKMDTLKADVSPRYVLFLWNKKNSGCSPTSSRSGEAESWEVSLVSLVSLVRCDVPPFAHPHDAISALQEIMSVLEPCQIVCTSNHLAGVQDLLAQLTVAHAYHCGPTDEGSEDHVTASISGSYASCPSLSALIDQFLLRFLVWKEGTPRIEWSRVALGELLRASHRCAILPVTTQRALHVFHDDVRQHASTVSSTTSGMTLLRFLDHCRTVGGSRLLRRWIASPLTDYSELQDRQRAVEAFASSNSSSGIGEETTRYLERCFALLRTSADPQATLARLRLAQCTVGELTGFVQLLLRLSQVAVASETDRRGISTSSLSDPVVAQCALLRDTFQQIEAADVPRLCHALAEEMNLEATKPQTVFEGVKKPPSSIEPLHAERELALDQLEQLLQRARKDMKMPSLEYSTVSGVPYLFDLKQTSSSSIPPDWTVVSRTKSSVRYQSQ